MQNGMNEGGITARCAPSCSSNRQALTVYPATLQMHRRTIHLRRLMNQKNHRTPIRLVSFDESTQPEQKLSPLQANQTQHTFSYTPRFSVVRNPAFNVLLEEINILETILFFHSPHTAQCLSMNSPLSVQSTKPGPFRNLVSRRDTDTVSDSRATSLAQYPTDRSGSLAASSSLPTKCHSEFLPVLCRS